MRAIVFVLFLLLSACGGRELGWLVPRASVGLVLRSTDTGLATEGFVALGAPLSGREAPPFHEPRVAAPRLHLLGPGPRCRVAPLCRWEAATRTQAFTELAEEEAP